MSKFPKTGQKLSEMGGLKLTGKAENAGLGPKMGVREGPKLAKNSCWGMGVLQKAW